MLNEIQLKQKPTWDEYFLTIAFIVAQRSIDPSTKCGCVIVSKFNTILATGYNGPLAGSNDQNVPIVRPQKYYHYLHAEENALLAYNGSHTDIQDSTAYITVAPCHKCLRMLIQKGITKIVAGPQISKVVDEEDLKAQNLMLHYYDLTDQKVPRVNQIIFPVEKVQNLLKQTDNYITQKYIP